MTEREKIIVTIQNRIDEARNKGLKTTTIFISTLSKCMALLKENEPQNVMAWRNAKIDKPESGDVVLAVKENKAGRRSICLATWYKDRDWADGWVTTGGNNNVIYWTPLPKIPEK